MQGCIYSTFKVHKAITTKIHRGNILLNTLFRTSSSTPKIYAHTLQLLLPRNSAKQNSPNDCLGFTDRLLDPSVWASIRQYSSSYDISPNALLALKKKIGLVGDKTMERWMDVGGFSVLPWSISGIESCTVVKREDLNIAFDIGAAIRESVSCKTVFITHGHIDHIGGIVKHGSHRSLYSMNPATYYCPPHLVGLLGKANDTFASIHDEKNSANFSEIDVRGLEPGQTLELNGNWLVKVFPTVHRVPSQGYLIYQRRKRMKPEYRELPGKLIGQLIKEGENIHDVSISPEVAYTGDTTFEFFENCPEPDIFKARVLITEATYIDNDTDSNGESSVHKAASRGHCHLQQFCDNAELFENVGDIIFMHLSDKYSVGYIKRRFKEILPASLRDKVHVGCLMKETF